MPDPREGEEAAHARQAFSNSMGGESSSPAKRRERRYGPDRGAITGPNPIPREKTITLRMGGLALIEGKSLPPLDTNISRSLGGTHKIALREGPGSRRPDPILGERTTTIQRKSSRQPHGRKKTVGRKEEKL